MEDCEYCDDRYISFDELLQHYEEAHAIQSDKNEGWTLRGQQHSSSLPNGWWKWSTQLQDIRSFDVQGHDARGMLDHSFDLRVRRLISPMAQGNSSPLSVGSGESQKTYGNFRTGVKRRAQSPIALERSRSNERNVSPPVWNPSRIFQQWNTAFGTLPNTHSDTGERLQNSPSPTPAVFGKTHPALVEPFADIKRWPREPNSHSEPGHRPQINSQSQRVAPVTTDGTRFQPKPYTHV